jgi:hypothetical protein
MCVWTHSHTCICPYLPQGLPTHVTLAYLCLLPLRRRHRIGLLAPSASAPRPALACVSERAHRRRVRLWMMLRYGLHHRVSAKCGQIDIYTLSPRASWPSSRGASYPALQSSHPRLLLSMGPRQELLPAMGYLGVVYAGGWVGGWVRACVRALGTGLLPAMGARQVPLPRRAHAPVTAPAPAARAQLARLSRACHSQRTLRSALCPSPPRQEPP